MERCLKLLPHKSYNTFGLVFLTLYVLFGFVITGIASDFDSKATLQCDPDKTLASYAPTRSNIETHCFLEYEEEFYPFSLPLYVLLAINVALVLALSIIYAYLVKHRVRIYTDPPNATTNGSTQNESQPLLVSVSEAASDPIAHQNSGCYIVFIIYIMHLFLCRIILLVGFATALLLTSSNFPVQFQCPWPMITTSTSHANFTQRQSTNFSTVDCTYPMGSQTEKVAFTFITVNFLFGAVAFMELAYLLWSTWNDRNLCTDIEFCCVYLLRKRKRIRKLMKKIRENISDNIFYLHDDFGEKSLSRRKLEEIYVDVIIQEGREGTWTRGFGNRHETYGAHFITPVNATILTRTADLFQPTRISKNHPRTVLVVGRPGIGKTLLTKNLFYQWQQQVSKFWHGKIVILIRFRTFNKGETSLREMLRQSDGLNMSSADFNCIYEYICLIPRNVILIFDGLDELNVNDESLTEGKTVNSHNEVTHMLLIFKQLVKGELLPGVKVLTTSRPTAEQVYKKLEFDREVEILGFHEEQIKQYVEMFCRNDLDQSTKIWTFIEESPELLSLCYLPVNSYIVCLTLKESIGIDEREDAEAHSINVPRTITELYKRAINILLYRHHLRYKDKQIPKDYIIAKLPEQLQNDLNKLKGIARDGMIKDQLIFVFKNDDKFVAELSDCGLFNKLEDKRQNIFCFLHLTIQEFLAALHVVDDINNVESFLSEHIGNPKWHLVIQFVAGLIGDKIRELKKERNGSKRSEEFMNKEKTIERICERFQDWMPKSERGRICCNEESLVAIECVHEMQEVRVMDRIASFAFEDDGGKHKELLLAELDISPMECTALFEFLGYIRNLNKLEITGCRTKHFVYRELAKFLFKDNDITALVMHCVDMTDQDAKHIIDALENEKCKVTKLDIGTNILTDESVKYLSGVLKSGNCKLTELDIGPNELTDESAKYLSDALKSNKCKLTKLDMSINNLTDEGAKYLSVALKSDNCKLTELNIRYNKLTHKGTKYLSDALKNDNGKHTELNIRWNKLTAEGAKYLSDDLENPQYQGTTSC